jgi:AcrR family transcriptional regulator
MPPVRDEQEFEQKRLQIMEGAIEAFAEKGFERATNKDIAKAAKIGSPGLIYHYFEDKFDILRQAIENLAPFLTKVFDNEEALFELPPQQLLYQFPNSVMQIWDKPIALALFKVLMGEALRSEEVATLLRMRGPGVLFSFFYRYFQRQIDAGIFRPVDPAIAVRSFMGPLLAYVLTREVLRIPDIQAISSEQMVNQAVEIFLRGVLVDPEQAKAQL